MLKFSGVQFASFLAGLENYEDDTFNFSVTGHSLTAGLATKWTTSWPINNSNAISSYQIQYTLDNVWRYSSGAVTVFYAANTYQVETITYYSGSSLVVETYVVNQTGGVIVIPQFFVNVRVSLFNAPF